MIAVDFLSHVFMEEEWKRPERIARKILQAEEFAFWKQQPDPRYALFQFWTAKEACYKMVSKESFVPRTFSPSSFICTFLSDGRFECRYLSQPYPGRWIRNEKGLLAVIQQPADVPVQSVWVPYASGDRSTARRAMLTELQASHPSFFGSLSLREFAERDVNSISRTYSSPWAVVSWEGDAEG